MSVRRYAQIRLLPDHLLVVGAAAKVAAGKVEIEDLRKSLKATYQQVAKAKDSIAESWRLLANAEKTVGVLAGRRPRSGNESATASKQRPNKPFNHRVVIWLMDEGVNVCADDFRGL